MYLIGAAVSEANDLSIMIHNFELAGTHPFVKTEGPKPEPKSLVADFGKKCLI
jgi:hypothetical protein